VSLPGQGPQACWPRSLDDNPLYHPAAGGCFGRASSMATRPPRPEDNVRAYPADFFDDDAGAAIDWPCRYLPARPSTVTKSLASVSADDHELHAHWDPDITMPAATHCFHAEPDVGGRPWPAADHPFCGSLKGIIPCGCGNQNGGDARGGAHQRQSQNVIGLFAAAAPDGRLGTAGNCVDCVGCRSQIVLGKAVPGRRVLCRCAGSSGYGRSVPCLPDIPVAADRVWVGLCEQTRRIRRSGAGQGRRDGRRLIW
jgi:hypothetical protein